MGGEIRKKELAKFIDHTALGPTISVEKISAVCQEAKEYGFASVCVNPCHTAVVRELLADVQVKVCVVIGFPHGMNTSVTKAFEAQRAIADGADELDMVINVAALKEGDYKTILADIKGICAAATKAPQEVLVKVILETSLLNDSEKVAGAILAKAGGSDFVKTSTGFGPGGATAEDITLLRRTVGQSLGVKAAGGIHDYDTAMTLINAGASRIGASHSIDIIAGAPD